MPLPRVFEPEVMSGAAEAGEYDEMDFSATDQLFAEHAAELSAGANRPVRVIVDLGSGNAKIPLAMCPLLPLGTQVFAIEMSAEMLSVAARNRARVSTPSVQLRLVNADAKRVPLRDRSAGMVISNSLIHHIPDPCQVFKEIARIAHPSAPILMRLSAPGKPAGFGAAAPNPRRPMEPAPANAFCRFTARRIHLGRGSANAG